jgi:hypothetical protein
MQGVRAVAAGDFQIEEPATRQYFAPQELVVPAKSGAKRIGVFSYGCVSPEVKRGVDQHGLGENRSRSLFS